MTEQKDPKAAQDAAQKLFDFVAGQIRDGASKESIVEQLVKRGVDPAEAGPLVDQYHQRVMATAQAEQMSGGSLGKGILGGLLGATVGGLIWGAIVVFANYELGLIAILVGFLAGWGVVLLSGGKKGLPLQVVAAATSIFGLIVGKYFAYYYLVNKQIAALSEKLAASGMLEKGAEAIGIKKVSILSPDLISGFAKDLPSMVQGYDILWVVLAIATAWYIPKGTGIKT